VSKGVLQTGVNAINGGHAGVAGIEKVRQWRLHYRECNE
jgi:hypothetical protein